VSWVTAYFHIKPLLIPNRQGPNFPWLNQSRPASLWVEYPGNKLAPRE